jgi:LysR family glycine cleavage system transcriptional activator
LLLEDQFAPVVSPTIAPMARRDLSQWSLIHFDWHRPPRVALGWDAWARAAGRQPSELPGGGVRYSEESHAIQAAVAGQGIALVSLLLVEEELRLGLLQVAAEPVLPALSYHLLKSSHHPPSEAVSVVESWLKRISGTTA